MFSIQTLENILFVDIETVSCVPTFGELDSRLQYHWQRKAVRVVKDGDPLDFDQIFRDRAGIYAEFGKVVCISCGYLRFPESGVPEITIKSYSGENEATLLTEFGEMLNKFMSKEGRNLCAHNGKEFDFPYLGRRYIINGMPVPYALRTQGKKPWEVNFMDTMELWKFGDYKSYTSLDLLAAILDVPSPKDEIDGSQVSAVFWEEKDIEKITRYCEKDVKTTAQILLRMSQLPLIPDAVEKTT
ncbi:MAG: ribonuclease H-like domain-containing protein [Bacteroidota bacterium]